MNPHQPSHQIEDEPAGRAHLAVAQAKASMVRARRILADSRALLLGQSKAESPATESHTAPGEPPGPGREPG